MQHGARLQCGAWNRGPLLDSVTKRGPGGMNAHSRHCIAGTTPLHASQNAGFERLNKRSTTKTENTTHRLCRRCLTQLRPLEAPLQHGARLQCGAWNRGPLLDSVTKRGPGGMNAHSRHCIAGTTPLHASQNVRESDNDNLAGNERLNKPSTTKTENTTHRLCRRCLTQLRPPEGPTATRRTAAMWRME